MLPVLNVFFSLPNLSRLKIGKKLESKSSTGWRELKLKLGLQKPKFEVELKNSRGMSSVLISGQFLTQWLNLRPWLEVALQDLLQSAWFLSPPTPFFF